MPSPVWHLAVKFGRKAKTVTDTTVAGFIQRRLSSWQED